jgi:hypothetical protein
MAADIDVPEFHLHFEGEGARNHAVPGSALAQAIQSLQRSIHLLAIAYEGRDIRERLRVSHELERKYAVTVGVPEHGGYDIPYVIGSNVRALFDPQDVAIVTQQHRDALAAVQASDPQALKRIIPAAQIRRDVVVAFKKMLPPRRSGLVLSIEDNFHEKLLDGYTALARLTPMLTEPVAPRVHPRIVTGTLDGLDFQSRSLTLRLPTGRRLSCAYNDDYEPILLENPREWIQVRGEAVLDEDDNLEELINISEIIEVDDDPVIIDSITIGNTTYTATQPLVFHISFEPDEGTYMATGNFHIVVCAETRIELESAISEALVFLWEEYVACDTSILTADARALREQIASTLVGVRNAT